MSTAAYTPRKGTLADSLLRHLEQADAGTQMPIPVIASEFGVAADSVITILRAAVVGGLLDFSQVVHEGKRCRAYHLPIPQAETAIEDTPLDMASDHDGCLSVGGLTIEGDRVFFSRKQLRAFVTYATTPLVLLPEREGQPS